MVLIMGSEGTNHSKTLSMLQRRIWSLPHVTSFMDAKLRPKRETFSTFQALMWFLINMNLMMGNQMTA